MFLDRCCSFLEVGVFCPGLIPPDVGLEDDDGVEDGEVAHPALHHSPPTL